MFNWQLQPASGGGGGERFADVSQRESKRIEGDRRESNLGEKLADVAVLRYSLSTLLTPGGEACAQNATSSLPEPDPMWVWLGGGSSPPRDRLVVERERLAEDLAASQQRAREAEERERRRQVVLGAVLGPALLLLAAGVLLVVRHFKLAKRRRQLAWPAPRAKPDLSGTRPRHVRDMSCRCGAPPASRRACAPRPAARGGRPPPAARCVRAAGAGLF